MAEETVAVGNVTVVEPAKKNNERAKAYAKALKALRRANPEEFEKYYAAACVEAGLTYRKRKSKAERDAEKQAARLAKARETVATIVEEFGPDVVTTANNLL